ncbi:MAG: CBS domain-containing protein [Lachnospiraceae bacterium]|nr:CBS domain-containing protein [Lachnospiraceae bacterium]MBR6350310.1 CBS domain-containing protein [Lachnospiraceae bacterium]
MSLFSIITPKIETHYLTEDVTIRQALEKFDYHKFSVVPLIAKDGTYLTTVSEGDILRYIKNQAKFDVEKAEKVKVRSIEKYRPYKACVNNVSDEEIFALALEQNFVPVVDDRNMYIGIVKRKDILNMMMGERNNK